MNRKSQLVIGLIRNPVISKGNIANRQIIKITAVSSFKSCYLNFRIGIEFLSDTPADGIQLHTVQIAVSHGIRQHSEKVSDSHCRLQNIPAFKSHLLNNIINGTDNGRTGVMSVQGTGSCRRIFLRRQSCMEFPEFPSPICLVFIESVRKSAPAHIAGKNFLLFRSCIPFFRFQFSEYLYGIHIGSEFCFCPAFAKMVICDVKIDCRNIHDFFCMNRGFNFLHQIQNLRILPAVYLRIVLNDCILAILALNQIQAARERRSCVLYPQSFHFISRKRLVCPHCFLKRAVLSELKRPLNLQIFHNIVMVDKMVRLGWYICVYLLCT